MEFRYPAERRVEGFEDNILRVGASGAKEALRNSQEKTTQGEEEEDDLSS